MSRRSPGPTVPPHKSRPSPFPRKWRGGLGGGGQVNALRSLPSVDRLLQSLTLRDSDLPRPLLVDAARAVLLEERERRRDGAAGLDHAALAELVGARVADQLAPRLRTVVNATGVLLHTN